MNLRKELYFTLAGLRGQPVGKYYKHFLEEEQRGIPLDTTKKSLINLLTHCKSSVPYYASKMETLRDSYEKNPEEYLLQFPILTKENIRSHHKELLSNDISQRHWYTYTSGGSTGKPVQLIHDWDYAAKSGAIKLLFSKLVGREIGESQIYLWGSTKDITNSTESWKAKLGNKINNTIFLDSFRMTKKEMRESIIIINDVQPKLIVSYAEAIFELASFAKRDEIDIVPQSAIITSAGKLFPFMRERIEEVFQCKVFDRYGSREVGDIACERPGYEGLWVAPWGNYVEIVDENGNRMPHGTEGEILITSLTNYVMPLVRYRIEDRGILSPHRRKRGLSGQFFEEIVGRSSDIFKTKNGTVVNPIYFIPLLDFRKWILRFQIVQESLSCIVFRIVKSECTPPQEELDEITSKTRSVMGDDCKVRFEFVAEIPSTTSGKFRYLKSELQILSN